MVWGGGVPGLGMGVYLVPGVYLAQGVPGQGGVPGLGGVCLLQVQGGARYSPC